MSDNPAPPKKAGSLRDRIAAFEKPQASSSGPTPPPPRAKPGSLVGQWKPKLVAPSAEDSDTDKGGMSTGDARQSISRGGGLRERMAALQGKGAFGAPADPNTPNAPPLPSEQGKARIWRTVVDSPPPPAAKHDEYDDDDGITTLPAADDTTKEENVDGDSEPKTEEELERERRAAIAARMAKLGGARVQYLSFSCQSVLNT
jgi:myosin tail region-interacting protein MTI1